MRLKEESGPGLRAFGSARRITKGLHCEGATAARAGARRPPRADSVGAQLTAAEYSANIIYVRVEVEASRVGCPRVARFVSFRSLLLGSCHAIQAPHAAAAATAPEGRGAATPD